MPRAELPKGNNRGGAIPDLRAKPEMHKLILRGTVKSKVSEHTLSGVEVMLIDLDTHSSTSVLSSVTGTFTLQLLPNKSYMIFLDEEGYKSKELSISTHNQKQHKSVSVVLNLEPK